MSQFGAHVASTLSNILSPRSLLQLPFFSSALFQQQNQPLAPYQSCTHPHLSCHNTTTVSNTCCFNYPGGQFLQTQFYDSNPAVGPADSWTIHGLWPDHCNGGFDQFCDTNREYSNISAIISPFDGSSELLDYMNKYWLPNRGSSQTLWSHEWNKHGTCISTLDAKCYPSYTGTGATPPHRYVFDYFNTTVSLFKTLDTYNFLADAGIVPSHQTTYTLSHLEKILHQAHGAEVTLRCHNGELNEMWYHFTVRGSVQSGQFVPSSPDGLKSNCPATGIRYLPKEPQASPTATSTGVVSPTSTSAPFTGKGYLQIHVQDPGPSTQAQSCLISTGHWYTSGTCARFHVQDDASDPSEDAHFFTLTSTKGPCSINEVGAFECSKTLPFQTIFSVHENTLSFRNATTFYASEVPGRFGKVEVYADDGGEDERRGVEIQIEWKGIA